MPSLWYCHECNAEMTPLRVPDPQCSQCQGSFVEELGGAENDDPRAFDPLPTAGTPGVREEAGGNPWPAQGGGGGVRYFFAPGSGGGARGQTTGLVAGGGPLAALMQAFNPAFLAQHNQAHEQAVSAAAAAHAERHTAAVGVGGGGVRSTESNMETDDDPPEVPVGNFGGANRGGNNNIGVATPGQQTVPIRNLASFLSGAFGPPQPHAADDPFNNPYAEDGPDAPLPPPPDPVIATIPFALSAAGGATSPLNYLVNLLNSVGGGGIQVFGQGGTGTANFGDFAWGETGFQAILQDLMDQAGGRGGPQPATPEIIEALPRSKVTQELLDLDSFNECPICRDDFSVDDELSNLPCKHQFHPECVKQWLTVSGTCPVCRFALVPQPGEHGEASIPAGVEAVVLEVADPSAASSSNTRISGGPRAGHPPGAFPRSGSGSSSEEERMDMEMGLPALEDLD